jgi:hypothetical protein
MQSHNTLGLDDIERLQKRGVRLAESYGNGSVFNEDKPLEGLTLKQRNRHKSTMNDVVNIGAGTRCVSCGMLYFCWVADCRTCGRQMDYNLGEREA